MDARSLDEYALDVVDAGIGLPERALGSLLRADDDVSARNRIADLSASDINLERVVASDLYVQRTHLYFQRRSALHPPVLPRLVRFPQQARRLRRLLSELRYRDTSAQTVLPLARLAIPEVLRFAVGNHRLRLHQWLHRMGWSAGNRSHRRKRCSVRSRRLVAVSVYGLHEGVAQYSRKLHGARLGKARVYRRLQSKHILEQPRRDRSRPRHNHADG